MYAEFFEGSEAELGGLYVELARKSAYNGSSTTTLWAHRTVHR
jgi:hypothetical protein